jgi:hypothetical protein
MDAGGLSGEHFWRRERFRTRVFLCDEGARMPQEHLMDILAQVGGVDAKFTLILVIVAVALLLIFKGGGGGAARAAHMTRTCRDCGATHPGFAKFCRRCGKRL